MEITIRSIEEFDRQIKRLSKKYHSLASDLQLFVNELKNNPIQGSNLGGGVRKLRMTITSKGKGKSGGARIITYNIQQNAECIVITLLTIYDKNELQNISDEFIKSLIENIR